MTTSSSRFNPVSAFVTGGRPKAIPARFVSGHDTQRGWLKFQYRPLVSYGL